MSDPVEAAERDKRLEDGDCWPVASNTQDAIQARARVRFVPKIRRDHLSQDECWTWMAYRNPDGYGEEPKP